MNLIIISFKNKYNDNWFISDSNDNSFINDSNDNFIYKWF